MLKAYPVLKSVQQVHLHGALYSNYNWFKGPVRMKMLHVNTSVGIKMPKLNANSIWLRGARPITNIVMMHDTQNEMTLLLNKINDCRDLCQSKSLFPLIICEVMLVSVFPQGLVLDTHLKMSYFGRGDGHFYCLINIGIIAQSSMCLLSQN